MEQTEIIQRTKELAAPYLAENSIELVDITYKRESAGMTLRLIVDTPGGIRLDECEALNVHLSNVLDKEDFIDEHYVIEVSSPGLDRPIKTDKDYGRSVGKELEVSTFVPIDGRKSHVGFLVSADADNVTLEAHGVKTVIPRNKIAAARLHIEF